MLLLSVYRSCFSEWALQVTVISESVVDIYKPPLAAMTVNVWNRAKGDPRLSAPNGPSFKGKFPQGTFAFPFEFPALPGDTLVKHPEDGKRRVRLSVYLNKRSSESSPYRRIWPASLCLVCVLFCLERDSDTLMFSLASYRIGITGSFSGNISYTAGVNVVREGFGAINQDFDTEFQYLPLCKALPRVKTPFPFIPSREDWPFRREVVGGWTLTPFGGRGRLGEELVELEGIVSEPLFAAFWC